jgi:hypothetical protein
METNGSMLKNYEIKTDPKIIIYVEADINDGDCVGSISEKDLTQENLDYLRVITNIYCNDFVTDNWRKWNPFSKYGIGDDEYDEDDDDACEEELSPEENELMRKKLELIYYFMESYLPPSPQDDANCHSVKEFRVFIISPEHSGELMCEDVTDEEIVRVWEANTKK